VITVLEETGFDSYVCVYELTDVKKYLGYSRAQLEEELKVEFKKSFIFKYGKEM